MKRFGQSRRGFLKATGLAMGATALSPQVVLGRECYRMHEGVLSEPQTGGTVDYMVHIKASPVEIAPKRIVSMITYNGQFPGPLLRFKEGREVTVEIFNDTDTPEQLHWTESFDGCGWIGRGGNAICSRAWKAEDFVHAGTVGIPFLPYS